MIHHTGQLSDVDIHNECRTSNSLRIHPFHLAQLKAASYDITPSIIAMSAKTGMLETVYRERQYPFRHFIVVSPKDSILLVSNEYIRLPPYIAGQVVSRVSKIAEGFGHISTSVDPGWSGALLIALRNPTKKPLRIYVGSSLYSKASDNPLATVSFVYLNSPAHIHKAEACCGMQIDLLEKMCYQKRSGICAWWQRALHPKRRAFTDFFFHYCEGNAEQQDLHHWDEFIQTFSGRNERLESAASDESAAVHRQKKTAPCDFIVRETVLSRAACFTQSHALLLRGLVIAAVIVLLLLALRGK